MSCLFDLCSQSNEIPADFCRQQIRYLLDNKTPSVDDDSFEIFGQQFHISVFLTDASSVFDLVRLHINKLEVESKSFGRIQNIVHLGQLKKDVGTFFNSVELYLQNLSKKVGCESDVIKLLNEIRGLLLDLGSLHELNPNLLEIVCKPAGKNHPGFVYFHICLESWWRVVKLLYTVSRFWPVLSDVSSFVRNLQNGETIDSNFSSLINLLVFDLVYLGSTNYKKAERSEYWLFICPCVDMFWRLLKGIVDELTRSQEIVQNFSDVIKNVVIQVLSEALNFDVGRLDLRSDQFLVQEHMHCLRDVGDKAEFCWNVVRNLSKLINETDNDKTNFVKVAVETLLNATIVGEFKTAKKLTNECEQKLRKYLSIYLHISSRRCNAVRHAPEILLEPFCKNIHEPFYGGRTLDELNVDNKQFARKCFDNIKAMCTRSSDDQFLWGGPQKTSFELFLLVVATHCNMYDEKLAKSICGRVFCKFHPQRVKSLPERGLLNFFDLFLLLAYQTDLNKVSEKIIEYVSGVDSADTNFVAKMNIITKRLVVLAMMFQDKGFNSSECTKNLCALMDNVVKHYSTSVQDLTVRKEIWSGFVAYVSALTELMQRFGETGGDCGESVLINVADLEAILKSARMVGDLKPSHLSVVFEFWTTLARRTLNLSAKFQISESSVCPKWIANVLDTIYAKIIPICKVHLEGIGISCENSSRTFFWLTLVVYYKDKSNGKSAFWDCFRFYVWHLSISGSNVCSFLTQFFTEDLAKTLGKLEKDKMVAAWLRCFFNTPKSEASLDLLGKFMVENYFACEELSYNNGEVFRQVCELARCSTQDEESWRSTLAQVAAFGVDLLKNVDDLNVYELTIGCLATLVECCANLIHRLNDSGSVLKKILDRTILLTFLAQSKENESKLLVIYDAFGQLIGGILRNCNCMYDKFLSNSIQQAYKLAFERLSTINSNDFSALNFNSLITPMNDESATNFRKSQFRKLFCDLLRCSNDAQLRLLVVFYSKLVNQSKNTNLLMEELQTTLNELFLAWFRCNDSSMTTFATCIIDGVCNRLIQIDGGRQIIFAAFAKVVQRNQQANERFVKITRLLRRNTNVNAILSDVLKEFNCDNNRISCGSPTVNFL